MRVHFVGIGGIGISALARFYRSFGNRVTGSDIRFSSLISDLRKEGISVSIGHKASNVSPSTDLVIHSAAIPDVNPELVRAKKLGKEIKSYAEAVGELTSQYVTFAVAGAHGKSTVTSLLALALIRAGYAPTVIVGTKLKEFGGSNFKKGRGKYLVIEADEYNKSFLHHSPFAAIILNIDREHLDTYKNLANVKRAFLKFAGNIREGGALVVNRDDKNIKNIADELRKIARARQIALVWYSLKDFHNQFALKIPGMHNISNALAVLALMRAVKAPKKPVIKALESYKGAWRRMEYRGELKIKVQSSKFKVKIYDDYAHHPAEIRATLQAFREKYPSAKIICVFQPHQAQRLKYLFREFTAAFDDADALVLLDTYKVAGRDKPRRGYSSADLAKKIAADNSQFKIRSSVMHLPSPSQLKPTLVKLSQGRKTVIIMMGAGDIADYTPQLLNTNSKVQSSNAK